jgi:hypothetical protein
VSKLVSSKQAKTSERECNVAAKFYAEVKPTTYEAEKVLADGRLTCLFLLADSVKNLSPFLGSKCSVSCSRFSLVSGICFGCLLHRYFICTIV